MPPRTQDNIAEGIESFQLPKALVTRIAKSNLPGETKFQKDTVNALVDSATRDDDYRAHEVAASHSRKTIAASDILQALELIELSEFVPLLEGELEIYRSAGKGPKTSAAVAKSKGKEKETLSETVHPDEEGSTRHPSQEEFEEEEEEEGDQGTQEGQGVILKNADDEEDAVEEDLNEEQDEEEQDGDDEPEEELVDNLAIEDEELRKDNQGLEDHHNEED
ncbi:hypothetical protein Clacol_008503 [Clathrus columnatus]|uniref:DNA polymerase epsilon subunit D n=1 Tax=Clathrus columnatus TaxID=1419009 RepID=A0AAV5AM94_9AGAM|nr:hypothetical protein Clacol_008503 [Clathrus columnatus]